jgi:hypothetical protein
MEPAQYADAIAPYATAQGVGTAGSPPLPTLRKAAQYGFADCALPFHVPPHELHHPGEHVAGLRQVGRAAGVAVGVDVFQRDLAAGLAVGGAEALRLVADAG